MRQVKEGDRVKVHYTLMPERDAVFYTTENSEPVTFTPGNREVLAGIEKGVIGMHPGEKKSVLLHPGDAFGSRRQGVTVSLRKCDIPEDVSLFVGRELEAQQSDGSPMTLFIKAISDETVTLDENHPLAGMDVLVKMELVDIL